MFWYALVLTGLANHDATAVPFIADSAADLTVLMRQPTVAKVAANAQASFLRRQEMLSTAELRALTSARAGA